MEQRIKLNDAMVWGEDQTGHAKVLRDEVSRLQNQVAVMFHEYQVDALISDAVILARGESR